MTTTPHIKCSNLDSWILETDFPNAVSPLSREQLESLQLSRLNRLLQRIQEKQQAFLPDSLSSLEDLKTLSFTTPQMLSAHPGQYLLTSQSAVSRVISGATSGTTGPAKRVFYSEQDTLHTIGFFVAGISEMVSSGQKVLIDFPFSGSFGLGDLISQAVSRIGCIPVPGIPGGTYTQRCQHLLGHRPDAYIGFPVSLLSLIRFWKTDPDLRSTAFPIRHALISGDSCPEGVVKELERLLENRLFPHYGSREMGLGGAITCPAHEGMHLRENHILAEIIGPDLKPVPDGHWGELVITTIGLEAMPLIRYRTGDYTRFLPDSCPCGSITRRLDTVSRFHPTGSSPHFSMERLDSLLFQIPEVIDYQISRKGSGYYLNVCTTSGTEEEKLNSLLHTFFYEISKNENRSDDIPANQFFIKEKKCLPEDTSLYPGKRFILSDS